MIASDGAGGGIVAWSDRRIGYADIYVQRIDRSGVQRWTTNGVALCAAPGVQGYPVIVSDGSGGAIVSWEDGRAGNYDIYARRVSSFGVPQWTPDGVAPCSDSTSQRIPSIVSDGTGGAIVAWSDFRAGNYDVYVQRVDASGDALWGFNGAALCSASGSQTDSRIAPDGSGGAIVAWDDDRSGRAHIFAQRIERLGQLGNPEPASTTVRDVPNDQGGRVKVSWSASYLDVDPTYDIGSYWIWRSVPPNVAERALARGANLVAESGGRPKPGIHNFMIRRNAIQTFAWEYVGTEPARGFAEYSFVVPTTSDSVASSNPFLGILIQANAAHSNAFWSSPPDSGYSVDNLAPQVPATFAGNHAGGVTRLHWGENREGDQAGYRLYRGDSASFVPGSTNLIAVQPDTGYSDAGPVGSYYKLSAVDVHGNESGFALLAPTSISEGGSAAPAALALAAPRPNPASDGALLSFAMPRAGRARLAIYDMSGRRVRTVSEGWLEAGEYHLPFDMRDDRGRRMPSGLYFVRFEAGPRSLVQRLAVVE